MTFEFTVLAFVLFAVAITSVAYVANERIKAALRQQNERARRQKRAMEVKFAAELATLSGIVRQHGADIQRLAFKSDPEGAKNGAFSKPWQASAEKRYVEALKEQNLIAVDNKIPEAVN